LDLFANANKCSRSEVVRIAVGFMVKHHPWLRLGQLLRLELKDEILTFAHKKKLGDEQPTDTSA
jgi:hypothetical protein